MPLKHRSFNGANKALPVLASSLALAGFNDVIQLDLERPDLSENDLVREVKDTELILFAGCMTPQWPEIDNLTQLVARHSSAPIIVGGYATKGAKDILCESSHLAALFDGEGEEGVVEIAKEVARGSFNTLRSSIRGVCFIDKSGDYHHSTAKTVADLDPYNQSFNFVHIPAIHNMDIFRAKDGRVLETGQVYDQRGCPYNCGFCNKSTESGSIRWLGDEAFREQLRLQKAKGIEAVYLDVDTATINRSNFLRHAQILKEEGLVWGTNTRIDAIDSALIQSAVDCGCAYMFFGVEHIVPEVVVAVGKFNGTMHSQCSQARHYPGSVRRVFGEMKRAGLPSSYFIILGLPAVEFETGVTHKPISYRPATFEDDMWAIGFGLDECEPDFLNLNLLRFMPGSIAADQADHPAFDCVRPSGNKPITGGYFLPRVAKKRGYAVPNNHGVYRLCESVGHNQPATTAVDAERVYETIRQTTGWINARIDAGRKPTTLFVDRQLMELGLVSRDDEGRYSLAPLHEFDSL